MKEVTEENSSNVIEVSFSSKKEENPNEIWPSSWVFDPLSGTIWFPGGLGLLQITLKVLLDGCTEYREVGRFNS